MRLLSDLTNYFIRRELTPLIVITLLLIIPVVPQSTARQIIGLSKKTPARKSLAPAPPMGWNSWDSYGTTVTEQEVKANADYMALNLSKHGWKYIVVDIQWYEPQAKARGYRPNAELVTDEHGRLLPAINRFPSAANGKGFKPLADYVHKKGLKFGIHIMRGIPRQAVRNNLPIFGTKSRAADIANTESICKWNTDMYGVDTGKRDGQAYYDSIVALYAKWGVDYIKADDMSSPFHGDEIAALHKAIKKSGRNIVLSLSPGPADINKFEDYRSNAQLWRISDDFWDRWVDLKGQFELCRKWYPHIGPDSWPDADMLPLGRIGIRAERGDDRRSRLTKDEQFTLMSLWAIFRSPLMFGGDLPSNDEFTLSLITNDEVLAVNQKSKGNRELFARDNQIAWIANAPNSKDKYLAFFNLDDNAPSKIKVLWSELGLSGRCLVRDLWRKSDLGIFQDEFSADVNPHGAVLLKIKEIKDQR